MTFRNRKILITGASSGIGAALAVHYAAPGIHLALSGRHAERLKTVVEACAAKGAATSWALLDVTDAVAMERWIQQEDDNAAIDLVIANAGISGGTGGVVKGEPAGQARRIFDANLTGVLNTLDPILPRMIARGHGQIALMSSLASFSGWPGAPAYSASKGAVRMYGEALRPGMAQFGVKVSVVCPGFIRTPMTAVNPYPMPFLMDAAKAARIIANRLDKNRGRIAFPWPTYFFSGFLGILPPSLSIRLMGRLPAKPSGGK